MMLLNKIIMLIQDLLVKIYKMMVTMSTEVNLTVKMKMKRIEALKNFHHQCQATKDNLKFKKNKNNFKNNTKMKDLVHRINIAQIKTMSLKFVVKLIKEEIIRVEDFHRCKVLLVNIDRQMKMMMSMKSQLDLKGKQPKVEIKGKI